MTRFSAAFNLAITNDDDWFDVGLRSDNNFGVDPFLIYQDDSNEWNTAHDHILKFFATAFDNVKASNGDRSSLYWNMAEQLLLFPEPPEFCFGVAENSIFGLGRGPELQQEMLESIVTALAHGKGSIPHMEYLEILAGGVGHDGISDMVCNILKSYFIRYTQNVCRRHGIPTEAIVVRNADWSADDCLWVSKRVSLPINPQHPERRTPILLVPEAFILDIPVASADGFVRYAAGAAELRRRFNIDLSRRVTKHMKAQLARNNFDLVDGYFADLESRPHDAYPIDDDPRRKLNRGQVGESVLAEFPTTTIPTSREQVPDFVAELVKNFAYLIENTNALRLVQYKDHMAAEKQVQDLFRATVTALCRQNGISVSPESNAGNGPVDFVFSKGWKDRALLEVKLVSNTHFWDGIMKQVRSYSRAEEIHSAFFVAIAYTDAEMSKASADKVAAAAALASEKYGIEIQAVVIDARPRPTGSKDRMTPTERAELRSALGDQDCTDDDARQWPG